ncbi:MAG: fatty acid oxidation complex subunit alpha FadB [Gammaproteobacteria bacterium]|jgi:3-hydroxyacyl-CoA dehydrogenase/enoyl-CoA hydratase/3-hydroxybutyryl-CoA epimerase/enoyl-CoA isomerase|nr:fatty acid oxidation complex subunit alpha FadB [Gammaproteobacteria bacterium]
MIYAGNAVQVAMHDEQIARLTFDLAGESVNKFNAATLKELADAVTAIKADSNIKGLMLTSAKSAFIVGADITEFLAFFEYPDEELIAMNMKVNETFNSIEDLPIPSVALINGMAFGGGFEVCLAADFRIMSEQGSVALPEVKLGIMPGWGGSVRLPRLIGVDNAIEWICGGGTKKAAVAMADGATDAVVAGDDLLASGVDLLQRCIAGELDFQQRKEQKRNKLGLGPIEQMMAFETAKGFVAGKAGPHYPAPVKAIKTIQKHAGMSRDKALLVEAKTFSELCKTEVAANLVGIFLADQYLKRTVKQHSRIAADVKQSAVLGAGIMGGGIAYQSAYKGIPIVMKDIADEALQLGLDEAAKILDKLVSRGRLDSRKMAKILNQIRPTLSYADLANVDIVVEAVVENPKIKSMVLADVEQQLPEHAVITSNTSTISIDLLAKALQDPSRFCGMHFFNPVHRMPLVEIIRGAKTSDETIATTVAYANAMGKKPVVVNDCPGFFVNRVLFPYFGGFGMLVEKGVDFLRIDKLMERFGWPMGPAYLLDVVGIDTAHHCQNVMAEGFPDRMAGQGEAVVSIMYEKQRFGQKNGVGFYVYEKDKKGRPQKVVDQEMVTSLAALATTPATMDDQQIIDFLMLPLCLEVARCLEEGIVASPAEADLALVYGLGFPPFIGGACKYMDTTGLQAVCDLADALADQSPLFAVPASMRAMAAAGETFYGNMQAKG